MEKRGGIASDRQVVDFFGRHIVDPCGTEAGNLRDFYIREAERVRTSFSDLNAKGDLERLINLYKNKQKRL
jgi:hypothetical protein